MTALSFEIRRRIAGEFDRLGWTYDLRTGDTIARSVATSGTVDPLALAKLVPTRSLARTRVSKDTVAAALSRALAGLDLTSFESEGATKAMRILFVAAAPLNEDRLRLDAEHREIKRALRSSSFRSDIGMESALASRPQDLIDELNRFKPTILHISGHGGPIGIALEDADGISTLISTQHLAQLVRVADPALRLVVLNTCESSHQAEPAVAHVDAAIGMTRQIGDGAARVFATQLYASLAEGVELSRAVEQAKLQMQLDGVGEDYTPRLYTRRGINPENIRFTGTT